MSEPNESSLSDAEARRRRQEALRALAQRELGTPTSSAPLATPAPGRPTPARGRPRWVIPVSTVLAVLLVGGVALHQFGLLPGQAAHSTTGAATVVIAPSLQGLECPHDAAWSPNGEQVAIIGYQGTCPSDLPSEYNYQAGLLNIYSAVTGLMIRTISPDATVLALPGIPQPASDVFPATAASDTSKPVINYTHVLWSPDGKELALTFSINRWKVNAIVNGAVSVPFSISTGVSGLVLMNADGSNERAGLFAGVKLQNTPPGALVRPQYAATEWDTNTLKAVALPAQPRFGDLVSLPAAPAYSWSSSGGLVPGGSSSGGPSADTPVGNPDGSSSFSMWQPGVIGFFSQAEVANSPVAVNPGVYAWYSTFPVWSPDGRYLVDTVSLLGTLHPAGEPVPTAAGLQAFGWVRINNYGVRDPAMQGLLTSLRVGTHSVQSVDHVAWSPNGRVLASIPEGSAGGEGVGNPTAETVTFYDSATGRSLGRLRTALNARVSSNDLSADRYLGSTSILLWSADGSHVLVYDDLSGTITIWGPGALPKA